MRAQIESIAHKQIMPDNAKHTEGQQENKSSCRTIILRKHTQFLKLYFLDATSLVH